MKRSQVKKLAPNLLNLIILGVIAIIVVIVLLATYHHSKPIAASKSNILLSVSRDDTNPKLDAHGYHTKVFTATSNKWGYKWSYDCTKAGKKPTFVVIVEDPNGKADYVNAYSGSVVEDVSIASKYPKASGTEQASKAGTFKILVGSGCKWSLKVLNKVGPTTSSLPST